MIFREWEEKEIETLLLTTIPKTDHKKAEKFMLETIERYKNKKSQSPKKEEY